MKIIKLLTLAALFASPGANAGCTVDYVNTLNSDAEVAEKMAEAKEKGMLNQLFTNDMACLEVLMRKNHFKSTAYLLQQQFGKDDNGVKNLNIKDAEKTVTQLN